jgi:ABC-type multidrug transport system fused ATPase/permease subunit
MSIQSNKRIAIVGSSGSGKSTLIQALLGLYSINQGEITINNTHLHDIGFDVVRDNISVVLQNPTMLNDTIRNNLTYYSDISDADIWHALEMAQLNSTIKAMESQLETQIGKKGVRLSGGQRQRLAIARMLLRNPKVVILDEATSALDLKTEHALFESLKQFLSERTSIIIAHRLSTIIDSDIIYVINNGTVAEQGHHDELMNFQGIYYSLYKLQQTH